MADSVAVVVQVEAEEAPGVGEHHYEFLGDKLIIGKFCAIAQGVKIIMNGANHKLKNNS